MDIQVELHVDYVTYTAVSERAIAHFQKHFGMGVQQVSLEGDITEALDKFPRDYVLTEWKNNYN